MGFVNPGQVENSGSGTFAALNGAVTVALPTASTIAFTITGTWVATLIFEATTDGTTWFTVLATIPVTGVSSSGTAVNNSFVAGTGGYQQFRVRASAYTSGTVAVAYNADTTPNVQGNGQVLGATDGTGIGNVGDRLKVDVSLNASGSFPSIYRTDVASAARTVSGNSGTLDSEGMGCLSFAVEITASSGTIPTMDLFLEVSDDGTNWTPFIQSKRFTGTGSQRFQALRFAGKYYRYRWTIAGTTPSFTFSIITTLKAYLSRRFTNKIQYAFDLTQATGTVSETFTAADSPNVSLMTIRATDGGTNAAYRVQVSNDDLTYVDITGNIAQGSNSQNISTYTGAYRFYRLILNVNSNAGTRVMDIHWAANG